MNILLRLYVATQYVIDTLANDDGQDLIEYALVVALIGFAAIAGMGTLATDISTAFTNIGTTLTSDT